MRDRLPYLAILLVSALAVVVGAWPSLLSLGAALGVGTGLVALAGLIAPRVVSSRQALRRFMFGGGATLTLELLLLALWVAVTPRRTIHLTVPSNAARVVRVVYGVRDGVSSAPWRWDRYFVADTAAVSIIRTRLGPDGGWFREGKPHPIEARTHAGMPVRARWIAGGYADAGRCRFTFDEFYVGDGTATPKDPSTQLAGGWLDSLSGWGVACRDGHLVRGPAAVPILKTSAPCYFDERGDVSCGISLSAS